MPDRAPIAVADVNTTRTSAIAGMHQLREYQRSLSKGRMNESRYRLSGISQRKGTTATSWHIWFVTARSSVEAQAGSATQRRRRPNVGGATSGSASFGTAGAAFQASRTVRAERRAKAAKATDQTISCWRVVSQGSTATG